MTPSRRALVQSVAGGLAFAVTPFRVMAGAAAPTPYGAVPSQRQSDWQAMEFYGFLHFTVDTFTDRDWGLGDEDPAIFNPTDFDADQIVAACKAGGMKQLILTAKHHDGFCLWPSAYTEHSIKNSPFQGGKGDIVRDISRACARAGLKFGVYLSPWDRNHAQYGQPEYVAYYHNQLTELLSNYGPIWEVWFDGANGGLGYYGGACETRTIDAPTYYQWAETYGIVRRLAPHAVMFADAHTEVRWVGNEAGVAGDPCWPTMSGLPFTPELGNSGIRGGSLWNPAEVDVSIRHSWFWHADENDKVRSVANLLKLYLTSVGRGACLLLNAPPDRRGRIFEADVAALKGFRDLLDQTFIRNFNSGAQVSASSVFSKAFAAAHVLQKGRAWAAREDDKAGAWIALDLAAPATFDLIRLREDTRYGVRVDDYVVEIEQDGQWIGIAQHTCIGAQRLIRLDAPVTAQKVRLRILKAAASPVISEFSLYRLPAIVEDPVISRDDQGTVTITAGADCRIVYSIDGSVPATVYDGPVALPGGGTVRAMATRTATGQDSAVISIDYDVVKTGWRIVSSNGDAPNVLLTWDESPDGDMCSAPARQPLDVVIDLGQIYDLQGFTLQRGQWMLYGGAAPAAYSVWVSEDGQTWGDPAAEGDCSQLVNCRSLRRFPFAQSHRGRYLRVHLPKAVNAKPIVSIARIGIVV